MIVPNKYLKLMSILQRAIKTADYSGVDKISLIDLKVAKRHLVRATVKSL